MYKIIIQPTKKKKKSHPHWNKNLFCSVENRVGISSVEKTLVPVPCRVREEKKGKGEELIIN